MNDGMNPVMHVNRTETGLTKMQIQIPISTPSRYGRVEQAFGHQPVGHRAVSPGSLPAGQRRASDCHGCPIRSDPPAGPETAPEAPAEAIAESPAEAPLVSTEAQAVTPMARKPRAKKEKSK